jgi:hypothetical protein
VRVVQDVVQVEIGTEYAETKEQQGPPICLGPCGPRNAEGSQRQTKRRKVPAQAHHVLVITDLDSMPSIPIIESAPLLQDGTQEVGIGGRGDNEQGQQPPPQLFPGGRPLGEVRPPGWLEEQDADGDEAEPHRRQGKDWWESKYPGHALEGVVRIIVGDQNSMQDTLQRNQ